MKFSVNFTCSRNREINFNSFAGSPFTCVCCLWRIIEGKKKGKGDKAIDICKARQV